MAMFVPERGEIPIYEGADDFKKKCRWTVGSWLHSSSAKRILFMMLPSISRSALISVLAKPLPEQKLMRLSTAPERLCKVLNYVKILIQDRITTTLLQQIS